MKLRLQNIGQATVVMKDHQGHSSWVAEVAGNTTVDVDITLDVLQRLAPQLRELEASVIKDEIGNVLVGFRWSVLADGTDDRAQTEGLAGLPSINELQAAGYSTGAGLTAAVATGTALLGNQVKATAQLFSGTKRLDLAAVLPGAPGNSLSAAIGTPTGVGSPVVTVVGNKVTVTPIAVGNTVTELAAAINADATAKLLVKATVGVDGAVTAAVAEKALTGGIGPGVSLTLGGTACTILELLATQVTFDAPAGISAASRIVELDYRCGPHLSDVSVPVIA